MDLITDPKLSSQNLSLEELEITWVLISHKLKISVTHIHIHLWFTIFFSTEFNTAVG